ncbi:sensor histidine kinase [Autumnicola psychrophila]|uniref:histidine kinase n=1 Tax=Autumnicola psychrophila TaxID=3075592 RepID=A0ABU3DU08_9FLAO|nr:PAS domain S-box protein [Zunongwangia sp. F225]MDT0687189.1 PAS domain S-box protein [Zunongwangia sp. F225]
MKSIVSENKDDFNRKAAQLQLDFRQMWEETDVPFYTCDKEGYLTFFNKAAVALWGRTPEIGKDLWCGSGKIYYPDGQQMPWEAHPLNQILRGRITPERQKIRIKRPDGTMRYLLTNPKPIFDANKNLMGAQNVLIDITGEKEDEIKQATLSAIVESSDDAIISKDLGGIITSWNQGAEKIFGYSENEVLGKSITILIPPERMKEEELIINKIKSGQKLDHFETIRMTKDGRELVISLTVSPVKDKNGNIIGASKIARDITAQVKAQSEIKKHTRNLEILNYIGRNISRSMDIQAILQQVTDATTKLTGAAFGAFFYNSINEQGEAYKLYTLSGAPREAFEHLGMPRNTEMFHSTFYGKEVIRVADVKKDKRYGHNKPLSGMPEGHLSVSSYMAVPVISASGSVIGGLLFGHSEKGIFKAEHEDLVLNIASQAAISLDNSKLFEQVKSLSAKKDEFIALASHELKTPLTTIKGYLQLLGQKESDPLSERFLNKSISQVNKLNTLVEDLLNMSRIEAGKLDYNIEVFDLKEMLRDIAETFSHSCKSHQIIQKISEVSALVEGDKQRIEQAVNNFLTNAVKYSPGANKVFLTLEVGERTAKVKIRDKGIGLTKEQQDQVFSRFYRAENTKGISGLGLGLYLTKQIIDRHSGKIEVKSEEGKGSEFSFTLPLKKKQ